MLFSIIIWVLVLWGITLVVNTKRIKKSDAAAVYETERLVE